MRTARLTALALTLLSTLVASCGGGTTNGDAATPTIVVTHSILGDIVASLVGEQAEVVTIMGPGADPHDFRASARQVQTMQRAEALIVNGGRFEIGLLDVIDQATAEGAPTHEALGDVAAIELDGNVDPHFFTDPRRVADSVRGIAEFLIAEVEGLDPAALRQSADAYLARLADLDTSVSTILSVIEPADRVLVTNHEVFGYFADRYDFTVIGTVLPGSSTDGSTSGGDLAALAATIEAAGVPAVFVETSAPVDLAQTLADEVGDIAVVPLFSESLGPVGSGGETYLELAATNAQRIADALAPAGP